MARTVTPDLSIVLTFLRRGQGWSQADLGEVSGISSTLLNDYERGRKNLTRQRLEHVVAFMGLPPEAIDRTLAALAAIRESGRTPGGPEDGGTPESRKIEALASRHGTAMTGFLRSTLSMLTVEAEALHARQRARILWDHLKKRTPAERRSLLQAKLQYRSWALCERIAAESIQKAPNHPKEALELAGLALLVAERAPGDQLWRQRLQGYAWAHVSNGRRVCNDLPGAEKSMVRAKKLWKAGETGDPGWLNEAWLPGLEAALRRDQRRFQEALKRIGEALALDTGDLRGEILLTKARIHEALGDPESSTAALFEAALLIDSRREPRNAFGVRFNLAVDLCLMERFAEAESRLPEVRVLAERLGGELDLTQVVWLEAKVAAGLGRDGEARAAYEHVRRVFSQRELALNYALVSLDLAVLFLEQGRTAEVKTLAEDMLRIFQTQKIEQETLAAIRLFCDAVRLEDASVDLARRLVKFLHRAQHDPELQFKE